MREKKITVIGPGSLGILFASKIWQHFKAVSILDYQEERSRRLASLGIVLLEPGERELVAFPKVTARSGDLGEQDIVLVLVKAFKTVEILGVLKTLCGPETLVVSLQNGLGAGDILARVVPRENLALGVTMHGANKKDFRTVVHAGSGPTVLGKYRPEKVLDKRLENLAEVLAMAGFECQVVSDIYPVIWKKLLVNVGINPITAISGLRNGQILNYPQLMAIQEKAVCEGFEVMQRSGCHLGMDVQQVLALVRRVCKDTGDNISSMLQDRLRGGKTEIEFINGAVVGLAKRFGLSAPVNETLCNLVDFFSQKACRSGVVKS